MMWPDRIRPGSVSDVETSTLDYLPTVLDMLGIEFPDERPIDGISLLPLFETGTLERPSGVPFWHRGKQALVEGDYKLIGPQDGAKDELYDLASDRAEARNIIAEHPDLAAQMRARLEAFTASARNSDDGGDY